jgi:hypothetical protein
VRGSASPNAIEYVFGVGQMARHFQSAPSEWRIQVNQQNAFALVHGSRAKQAEKRCGKIIERVIFSKRLLSRENRRAAWIVMIIITY